MSLPEGVRVLDADLRAWTLDGSRVAVAFDESIYAAAALARAAYKLTDRAFVVLHRSGSDVVVVIKPKEPAGDLSALAGELANEALDQVVRASLHAEFVGIQQAIVDEAFRPVGRR